MLNVGVICFLTQLRNTLISSAKSMQMQTITDQLLSNCWPNIGDMSAIFGEENESSLLGAAAVAAAAASASR